MQLILFLFLFQSSTDLRDLLEQLARDDPFISSQASAEIFIYGPGAAHSLIVLWREKQNTHNTEGLRNTIVDLIGKLGTQITTYPSKEGEEIINGLDEIVWKDGAEDVKASAISALAKQKLQSKNVVPKLERYLNYYSDTPRLRRESVLALAAFGAEAADAVKSIKGQLKDDDLSVKRASANALGQIGMGARTGIPDLISALNDPEISGLAAESLAKIALGLAYSHATDSINELESARDALLKRELAAPAENLAKAISHLKDVNKESLWTILFEYTIVKIILGIIVFFAFWPILWIVIMFAKPLILIQLNNSKFIAGFNNGIKVLGIEIKFPLNDISFLSGFCYSNYVLDAWVRQHQKRIVEVALKNYGFDKIKGDSLGVVQVDGTRVKSFTQEMLYPVFQNKRFLLLILCDDIERRKQKLLMVLRWVLMSGNKYAYPHPVVPIAISDSNILNAEASAQSLLDACNGQLQMILGSPTHEDLLRELLNAGRILILIDGLSEMPNIQKILKPEQKGFPINALIVTSQEIRVLSDAIKTTLKF